MWLSDELTLRNTIHGSPFSDGDQLIKNPVMTDITLWPFSCKGWNGSFQQHCWRYFKSRGHYQQLHSKQLSPGSGDRKPKPPVGAPESPAASPLLSACLNFRSQWQMFHPCHPRLLLLVAILSAECKVIPPWIHFSSFASNNDLALRPPLLDGGNYSIKMF